MKRASSSRKSESNLQHLKALKDSEIVVDDDVPAWSPEMFARAIVKRGLDTTITKREKHDYSTRPTQKDRLLPDLQRQAARSGARRRLLLNDFD